MSTGRRRRMWMWQDGVDDGSSDGKDNGLR